MWECHDVIQDVNLSKVKVAFFFLLYSISELKGVTASKLCMLRNVVSVVCVHLNTLLGAWPMAALLQQHD